ncbi:hypothetical protein Sfulv_03470 [Streptomyces fulvorobeus]|uniref:Uncharacterized protein n=1 Tax=Streptomyces fulvorobeus TaxID=284028 RepID=A0A7J0C1B6_9ACTN|nr:hypothetical protein Sfulv_03470 [Streptomyces fulvorobeus]
MDGRLRPEFRPGVDEGRAIGPLPAPAARRAHVRVTVAAGVRDREAGALVVTSWLSAYRRQSAAPAAP